MSKILIVFGIIAVAVVVLLVVFLTPGSDPSLPEQPPAADAPAVPPDPGDPSGDIAVEPPPLIDLPDIHGGGEEIFVDGETVYHFVPDESGTWVFTTLNRDGNPMLIIYNQYGVAIAQDDGSADDGNAIISIELEAGHRYTVHATFADGLIDGNYTLRVEN